VIVNKFGTSAGLARVVFGYLREGALMAQLCSLVGIALVLCGLAAVVTGILEFGFILLGLAVMAWFAGWVLQQRLYGDALLVIMFLAGYAISWGVGFLGYRYLLFDYALSLGFPTEHMVTTAILVFISIVATVAGASGVLSFCRRSTREHPIAGRRGTLLQILVVFAGIYIVFQSISLHVLGLNARSEIGNIRQIGSSSYLVAGLQMVAYPFYALLGMSLKRRLVSVWNLTIAVTMVFVVGVLSLTGGRSAALEPLVVLFIGATFSIVPWRRIALLSAASIPLVVFVMIVLGTARGTGGFSGGDVGDKMAAISSVVREGRNEGDQYDSPLFVLFSRLFEPSAQAVIDHVAETGHHVGFLNSERLLYVFVPQFAYPAKKPLDDSNERLALDYGYAVNEYTSAPLTLLADSYERFGVVGVVVFHLLAGALLGAVGALIFRIRERILALVLLICCARAALLMYPVSTLGFFHMLLYGLLRDVVVISLLYGSALFLIKTLRRSHGINSRPPVNTPAV
jgi:hypothetical protein